MNNTQPQHTEGQANPDAQQVSREAEIISLDAARASRSKAGEVLNESPEAQLQVLLEEVTALEDKSIKGADAKEYKRRAQEILEQAKAKGIIDIVPADKDDFIKITSGHESEGQEIKQIHRAIIETIKAKRIEVTSEPVVETKEKSAEDPINTILLELRKATSLDATNYATLKALVIQHMDEYVSEGIIVKNGENYEAVESHGKLSRRIIAEFNEIRGILRKFKPEERKKDKREKPAEKERGNSEVNPIAITIDGQTFETPAEALGYANGLGKKADDFRTRYYAELEKRMEGINREITSGIERVKKADRIATSGRNIGVLDLMKPFVAGLIVKYNGATYRPNPDIERAKELTDAANAQLKRIDEEVKKRRAAYEAILHSEGGFERIVPTDDGRGESARYAYQIHIEKKAGKPIIVVDKVEVKFTDGSVRLLNQGNQFLLGHSDTPPFLNEKARELMAKEGKDAEKK